MLSITTAHGNPCDSFLILLPPNVSLASCHFN